MIELDAIVFAESSPRFLQMLVNGRLLMFLPILGGWLDWAIGELVMSELGDERLEWRAIVTARYSFTCNFVVLYLDYAGLEQGGGHWAVTRKLE